MEVSAVVVGGGRGGGAFDGGAVDDASSTATTVPASIPPCVADVDEADFFADTVPDTLPADVALLGLPPVPDLQEMETLPDTFPDTVRDTAVLNMDAVALEPALASLGELYDDHADWLRRANGSCGDGEIMGPPRHVRRATRDRSRSRNRHAECASAAPSAGMFFPITRFSSFGEACYEALVGHTRRGRALCSMLDGTVSYADAAAFARKKVEAYVSSGVSFYIGITENPERRFEEHLGSGVNWDEQIILVEARTSATTASLEQELLAYFGKWSRCTNLSRGGECASSGSPHFLYLLLLSHHPLRRRPSTRRSND